MSRPECPKCGSLDLLVQLRPDGDAECHDCPWSGPYKECQPAAPASAPSVKYLWFAGKDGWQVTSFDPRTDPAIGYKGSELYVEKAAFDSVVKDRESYYHDFRVKHDIETKQLCEQVERLEAELKELKSPEQFGDGPMTCPRCGKYADGIGNFRRQIAALEAENFELSKVGGHIEKIATLERELKALEIVKSEMHDRLRG